MATSKYHSQVTLFSETDSHGTITFVNEAFCEASKYSKEELLGQPHNIIRHPDMPKKLFEIIWSTIKSDQIFRGVIKNKAKDNSPYWVQAIIMQAINKKNEEIKYIGVRHLIEDHNKAMAMYEVQAKALHL